MHSRKPAASIDFALFTATYVVQFSILLFLLAFHRLGDRPVVGPLSSLTRIALLGSAALSAGALAVVFLRLRHPAKWDRKARIFTMMLSLMSLIMMLVAGEVLVRVFSVRHADLVVFLNTELMPRNWKAVTKHYRGVIQ